MFAQTEGLPAVPRRVAGRRPGAAVSRLAIICAVALPGAMSAQGVAERGDTRLVRGRVVMATEGAPLADAAIGLLDGVSRVATASGATGSFALSVPRGSVRLVATRIGFHPETLSVAGDESTVIARMRKAPLSLGAVVIQGERATSAASSSTIRQLDLAIRPRESSQELLRLVPGLVIAQHAGGGKAEQIFLRGFDADHGTDVAVSVDGTPVNMVSHAHGQGYADLHFVIPEVIDRVDVRKGPFDVRDGDFATAGAVAFQTKDRIDAAAIGVRDGTFDTRHVLAMTPFGGDAAHAGGFAAVAAHYTNGAFEAPQDYRRFNGFAKWTAPVGSGAELVTSTSAFGGRWNASGEIPSRAVRDGRIGRFGALDRSEGGSTQRYDASVGLRSTDGGADSWDVRAYAARYRFQLFSDFTFFREDSINGDGIEQDDDRSVIGGTASYGRSASTYGHVARWRIGVGTRSDGGAVALHHQKARSRLDTRVDVRERITSASTWALYAIELSDRVRLDAGVRGDLFRFGVTNRLPPSVAADLPHPSGARTQGIVSPKVNLAVDLTRATTLFANVGSGFHSNDARGVALAGQGDRVLPRALSSELGTRHTWEGGSVAGSLWALDLEDELVWSGDEGTTSSSGRTRRVGVDIEGRNRVASWLWLDADVNLARGRFRDRPRGADLVALAPTLTATAGVTVRDAGPVEGGLRVRHVAPRTANDDNSVRAVGYTVSELFGSYQVARVRLFAAVDNLLDTTWNEAQFATTSRLRGEPAPVTELHFTPGAPRTVQLGVTYRF